MPEESKNKLAGMIALKQKEVVKSPAKPAPAKPKEPPKPSAVDKLMAAKGQTQRVPGKKAEPPPPKPPPRPAGNQKQVSAPADAARVPAQKPQPSPAAASASAVPQPVRPETPAKSPKPRPAPAPKRPPKPGVLTKLVAKFQVYIKEEIQEIKRELSPKHLLKPFTSGMKSVKKGASYLKERLSEDTAENRDLYGDTGPRPERLRAVDRSDQNGDIAIVTDEKKQAMQYGAALQQIGSIRQRQTHRVRPHSQEVEDPLPAAAGQNQDAILALAIPGAQPPTPAGRVPEAASSEPVAPQSGSLEQQIGNALAQMGSIRDRESRDQRKTEGPKPDSVEPIADRTNAPPATEAAPSAAGGELPGAIGSTFPDASPDAGGLVSRSVPGPQQASSFPQSPDAPLPREAPAPASAADAVPGPEPMVRREAPPEEAGAVPAAAAKLPTARKKGAPRKASKTEHQIRAIRSLQAIFGNTTWRMALVDPGFKPAQLYIPRKAFEENFGDAGFRNGMKAASRIAMAFASEWKEPVFDERLLEEVLVYEFPKVRGVEDPDEKQIAGKCDKETAKRIERFVESDEIKRLLRNTGAKLGVFVPSIEIVARIYLSLKKGGDMDPKARLDIQRDVLFKYQKVKYPEKSARKARNIALRYFFEYLVGYGVEIYKERKANALEIKTMAEAAMEARFESLREVACNLAAERATKAALSAQVITELREQIRNAIRDFEMGIEPGTETALASEEDEEEDEGKPGGAEESPDPAPADKEA